MTSSDDANREDIQGEDSDAAAFQGVEESMYQDYLEDIKGAGEEEGAEKDIQGEDSQSEFKIFNEMIQDNLDNERIKDYLDNEMKKDYQMIQMIEAEGGEEGGTSDWNFQGGDQSSAQPLKDIDISNQDEIQEDFSIKPPLSLVDLRMMILYREILKRWQDGEVQGREIKGGVLLVMMRRLSSRILQLLGEMELEPGESNLSDLEEEYERYSDIEGEPEEGNVEEMEEGEEEM